MKLFDSNVLFVYIVFICCIQLSSAFVGEKLLNAAGLMSTKSTSKDPLMVRAARGEPVERVPVWIMRQAGRHMKVYRDLVKKHPTFRERSENVDLSTEISLQPVRAYDVDGCILFSDILTPLPAMGIEFDILEGKGPIISNSQRYITASGIEKHVKPIDLENNLHFVGETLQRLRKEMHGTDKTVLGFVGLPFTLAAYSK